MSLADAVVAGLHLLFGAVWVGSVLFVTFAVVPIARDGLLDSEPLARLTDRFKLIARSGAAVTLLTGAHQAVTMYTVDGLLDTTRGHLIVAMILLWVALAAFSEIGAGKLTDGTEKRKVRTPASKARPFLLAASAVAVLLLLDAGWLSMLS